MNIFDKTLKNDYSKINYKDFNRNEVVFHEQDLCKSIGVVTNGCLKIVSYLDDGKEIVYNIINKDEIFGNNLIFSSSPYYKGDVIAIEKSTVAFLDEYDLFELLKINDAFLLEYLKIQSDFGKALNSKIKLLSLQSAKERLMFHLNNNNGTITIKSVSDLALQLDLNRETVSRLISKLINDKIITKTNKTISILKENSD